MEKRTPIAVVGMAGLFPGAPNLDIFWHNIINKVDAACEVPKDRWIAEPDSMYAPEPMPDKAFSKRACLINDFKFDPKDINIDKGLLNELDPLFHIALHTGREAFNSCNTSSVDKDRIGTVLAAIVLPTDSSSSITRKILGTSFEEKLFGNTILNEKNSLSRNQCLAGKVVGLPAAILARGLGLGGGSYTLDAACASSIYAVKLACDELYFHRADAMLAGGVSRPECLYTQVGFSQLRALSPSGRCAPFDKTADGLVVGEGAGILVLKRLDDALRDMDTIHGVIRGIGLSNDMRGNLLAPDSKGQVRAMRNAYASAAWSPHDVDLIECHGAGTPVGDTIELGSLRDLWGESGWSFKQCAIGSVKSMIGHLLTAAGAAGMIKTLLALKHNVLPPSLNFTKAPEKSPLLKSPFRVQTNAEEWTGRQTNTPLRAAVSAFGFGGINAHLLFEEWIPNAEPTTRNPKPETRNPKPETRNSQPATRNPQPETRNPQPPVAIVGMEAAFGSLTSLRAFQEAIFSGESTIGKRPKDRWKGCENIAYKNLDRQDLCGGFMEDITLSIDEFRIPPNEIPDILPQQLLMLKVAAGAMKDAGLPLRENRQHMGVIIGMDFDFEATNFHLRWNLHNLVKKWIKRPELNLSGRNLNDEEIAMWLESLRESMGPPLTPVRTLGALGGIIASRIAREFRFGGPSFVVSEEETSGLKALQIGVRALQQNEIDAVVVGAIDLAGDLRNIIMSDKIRSFTKNSKIKPFDRKADGPLPGEGAAALVIKRLDQAIKDGNRIYSLIKGIGNAGGGGIETNTPSKDAYILSLKRSFQDAGIHPSDISYFETHGSGNPLDDRVETEAIHEFFHQRKDACAIGSVKPVIGHTGAAAGLASIVKTSLCLYQEIIPPLIHFSSPGNTIWQKETFHIPGFPQYWLRDRRNGSRKACTAAMTPNGNCMHVILEGFEYEPADMDTPPDSIIERVGQERKRPAGLMPFGLFIVEGNNKNDLLRGLDALASHLKTYAGKELITRNPKPETRNSQPETRNSQPETRNSQPATRNPQPATRNPKPVTRNPQPATRNPQLELAARAWYLLNKPDHEKKYGVSLAGGDFSKLETWITDAKNAVLSDTPKQMNGRSGISYSPDPLYHADETAFVFPGSGNHYVGMGRDLGMQWPEILRMMDNETFRLKTQLIPRCYVPQRVSWDQGWEQKAHEKIAPDPLHMIFGQVVHGAVVANLVKGFGIKPSAVIGYSLGESAGLFAMGAWPDREKMLERMLHTNLFSTELAGPCNAARKAWNVPPEESVNWCVAAVNRPAGTVQKVINNWPTTRLLIVNTPDECVIGGRKKHVEAAITMIGCEAVFLEGVVTVHCDAAAPVEKEYRELHVFPTTPPEGIRFYSCAQGKSYELTSNSAADSIIKQTISGFDFAALIEQAYKDGVRIFLEMGPHSSCTRMIDRILDTKPHLALSACVRGEQDFISVLKFLGSLIAERVPVDLEKLYGNDSYSHEVIESAEEIPQKKMTLIFGGKAPTPALPPETRNLQPATRNSQPETRNPQPATRNPQLATRNPQPASRIPHPAIRNPQSAIESSGFQHSELIDSLTENVKATADAHRTFLDFSNELTRAYGKAFEFQAQLLECEMRDGEWGNLISDSILKETVADSKTKGHPEFSRELCMEFATGSAAKVLGPEFAVVDTYNARVRLPDEPLMLVDRILSVEGEKGSLGSGRVVTEHDVLPGAWYLDGGRAPVCISVEAGQADLFLCAYLGIDLAVKGKRTYRLLDASVKFHRGLPCSGDIIRYEIIIEKFVRQKDTYLFFFSFEGFIGTTHLITMSHGCAGFFTKEEVQNSGGIVLTDEDARPMQGKKRPDWKELVPVRTDSYNDEAVEALRNGDLKGCFGTLFNGIEIAESLKLPKGRMRLIDRILLLDPNAGRYGLGLIRAEADIHPDDWFLTCHFMDDMVMPGTLMYECCAHTLRVFVQRIGWVTNKPDVCYEPVIGVESILKCRGPVTPDTRHVIYEVEIKEIGYMPEPYVIADAHMYADDHRIVMFKDMSMKMTGITREEIESSWDKSELIADRGSRIAESKEEQSAYDSPGIEYQASSIQHPVSSIQHQVSGIRRAAIYDRDKILAFATGKPSEAFGEPYRVFDTERVIARLPGPPYSFLDRITRVEPEAWVLKPDGWIEAEYDVHPDQWYFKADRSASMPFCVLLEIALQPCGWLAAYMGSALKSKNDLKFRNLGGNAVLHYNIIPEKKPLHIRSRLTRVSEAGEMIIEQFDMEVLQAGKMIYEGDTSFGFFSKEALAQQVGIRGADKDIYIPSPGEIKKGVSYRFVDEAPFTPDDPSAEPAPCLAMPAKALLMPAKALLMIDNIEIYVPDGGPSGLGFIRGVKIVNPGEWFFKAHFYQDPVCPGSLGIESFLQLIKYIAIDRWGHFTDSHRFELVTNKPHNWIYRGQIIPENNRIEVEAVVTGIQDHPVPTIFANGVLKVDGLCIYKMENFGFRLAPVD